MLHDTNLKSYGGFIAIDAAQLANIGGGNTSGNEVGGGGGGGGPTFDLSGLADLFDTQIVQDLYNRLAAAWDEPTDEQKIHNSFDPFAEGAEAHANYATDGNGNTFIDTDFNGFYDRVTREGADGDVWYTDDGQVWKRAWIEVGQTNSIAVGVFE